MRPIIQESYVRQALIPLSLFFLVAFVYYESPVHYAEDSTYSLLMSEAILHQGSPNMFGYHVRRVTGPGIVNDYSWQIAVVNGRLIYAYPWGLPILSLPAVAIANAVGYAVAPNHVYSRENEIRMQAVFSALLCALVACLVFEAAASLLPLWWSLTIALSVAFGTQMWSDVSRSLWPQAWYLLLVTWVICLLLHGRYRPWQLAMLLVWAGFVRPMTAPTLLILGLYILIELKFARARVIYIASGLFWAGVLGGLMLFFVGHLLAPIYNNNIGLMTTEGFTGRLLGSLFSPGRGLLIYVPLLLIPLYLSVCYWRQLPQRRLAVLALAAILTTTITLACWRRWWGGWSYGPRLLVETVPWFSLLAILGIKAFLDDSHITANRRAMRLAIAGLLLIVSIMMNVPGALSPAGMEWNGKPNLIDAHPERLWDWRHPQFLAWYPPSYFNAPPGGWEGYGRRAHLEERRQAAINMQRQMLARGDTKAADRLGVVIHELDNQLGY
jgi:hypothetical protein